MSINNKKIYLINPRGMCAGVKRALAIFDKALEKYGKPIYVHHHLVHNEYLIDKLGQKGAVFVEKIEEIPENSIVIFSAHGVSPQVREEAGERKLKIIDATCPFVAKVHEEAKNYSQKGFSIIYIGIKGQQEAIGVTGEAPMYLIENEKDAEKININMDMPVVCLMQTTFSTNKADKIIKLLKNKLPKLILPDKIDICYATQNRQGAIKKYLSCADLILVIGSKNSSNCSSLADIVEEKGVKAILVQDKSEIDERIVRGANSIIITAGASTPEELVVEVTNYVKKIFNIAAEEIGDREKQVEFSLPII